MKLLDDYFELQKQIYEYFDYAEDWRVFPIDDSRQYFWHLEDEDHGTVHFAKTEAELKSQSGNYYTNDIYTYRHLPKWIYRGDEYTMIVVDTHTDGNMFLQIFSNDLERPEVTLDD